MAPSGGRCLCFTQISQWPFWDASPPILRNSIAQVFENPTFGGSSLKTKFKNTFMYSSSSVGYFCPQFGTESKAKHISKDFYPVCLHSHPVMQILYTTKPMLSKKRHYISNTYLREWTFSSSTITHPYFYYYSYPSMTLAWKFSIFFYRTWVRSLAMLVSDWLTNWLLFSKLDWCDPGL